MLLVIHVNVQVRGPKDRSNAVKTEWFFDMDILTYVTWLWFIRFLPGEGFEDVSFDVNFASVTAYFLMDLVWKLQDPKTEGPEHSWTIWLLVKTLAPSEPQNSW